MKRRWYLLKAFSDRNPNDRLVLLVDRISTVLSRNGIADANHILIAERNVLKGELLTERNEMKRRLEDSAENDLDLEAQVTILQDTILRALRAANITNPKEPK